MAKVKNGYQCQTKYCKREIAHEDLMEHAREHRATQREKDEEVTKVLYFEYKNGKKVRELRC